MNETENSWDKEQEQIKIESAYRRKVYNSVESLPTLWLPQEELKQEMAPIAQRIKKILEVVPSLYGINLKDSLKRTWNIEFDREEGSDDVIVAMDREENEHIYFSWDEEGVDLFYAIRYWPGNEGWPQNNLAAIKITKEKFDDLFAPFEKALGIKEEGEPLSRSR